MDKGRKTESSTVSIGERMSVDIRRLLIEAVKPREPSTLELAQALCYWRMRREIRNSPIVR